MIAKAFDHVTLRDHDSFPAALFAECCRDQDIIVHDQGL